MSNYKNTEVKSNPTICMQLTQHLEKLELLCTNNKLAFNYVMKFGTDLSASLVLQNKFRVFKTRSHLVAHEENRKETSFLFPFFLILFIHVFASTGYYTVQSLELKFPTN